MGNSDDVIDNDDNGDIAIPMAEAPVGFSLKATLQYFATLVVKQTIPTKKKGWRAKIENEWATIREQFRDKTPGTQKGYISKFRKAVKDAITDAEDNEDRIEQLLTEVVRGILIIEDDIREAVEEEAKKRIREYSTTLIKLTEWEDLLEEFQLLLHHPEPRFIAVGLMAVTGRRFSEIVQSGEIGPVYNTRGGQKVTRRYEVAFSGQAKTRGAEGTLHGQTYVIPVNAEANDVVRAFERMRNSSEGKVWKNLDKSALNSTPNKALNRALQERSDIVKHWPKDGKDSALSLKMLRPFYAEIAYHFHAPDSITKGAYFAKILGHAADDYHSAMSYMRFTLGAKFEGAAQKEIKRLQRLHEEQQAAVKTSPGKQPDD